MRKVRRNFCFMAAISTLLVALFFYSSTPVTSMGTLTLSGSASGAVGLFGSPTKSLTTAPGQTGTSISLDSDSPAAPAANFTGAVNFGQLASGDGTSSVASFSLRERGNVKCRVSASVSAYTATNISYNGTSLAGGDGEELTFVTLGNGAVTAGAQGNSAGHSYGSMFDGTHTLSELNSGTIGPVSDSSSQFDSYSVKPSNSGSLASTDNYVQDTVTFAIPTGFVWAPTNDTGTGTFSIAVQFEIYTGP